jgi:dihydroorotase
MIDPHVHLRDWGHAAKETLEHGFSVAWRAGLDAVFEMPNTDPPLTGRDAVLRRIEDADRVLDRLGIGLYHGIWAGVTVDPAQLEEVVRLYNELSPRVVGLKMFAGHSTGGMGIVAPEQQREVWRMLTGLGFDGVLAVHCEKERLLRRAPDGSAEWEPARPSSWADARPAEAEAVSVEEQIAFARQAGFRGTLHIVHVSVPAALKRVVAAKAAGQRLTCGLTPHHALLSAAAMDGVGGVLLKTNPPLRRDPMPALMLEALLDGRIDWVESDHAPHTLADKRDSHASGIPVLPFWPRFVESLRDRSMKPELLERVTHEAACATFNVAIEDRRRPGEAGLAREYPFDPFSRVEEPR